VQHLLDEQKRKELMIIYTEDLAQTGFSAVDLQKRRQSIRPVARDRQKDLSERA